MAKRTKGEMEQYREKDGQGEEEEGKEGRYMEKEGRVEEDEGSKLIIYE